MKHDEQSDSMQQYFDDSDQLENANQPLPMNFPLRNIPLYHAQYHQHNQYTHNASNSHNESIRNRSTVRKRASGEKQISTNITMVLEDLLK